MLVLFEIYYTLPTKSQKCFLSNYNILIQFGNII